MKELTSIGWQKLKLSFRMTETMGREVSTADSCGIGIKITDYHLTLKIASVQVVETSVTNNSPSQDSNHPDDLLLQSSVTQSLHLVVTCNILSAIKMDLGLTALWIANIV